MTLLSTASPSNTYLRIGVWALQLLAAAVSLAAGSMKLYGVEAMVQSFSDIGVGQWFRYLTGGLEVVAGVLLVVPQLAWLGALLMIPTMIGAAITHLFIVGGSAVPALVLLAWVGAIFWLRRPAFLR